MPNPSTETIKIRRIIERLGDEEFLAATPKRLKEKVESVGLAYEEVRDKINNELARARRKRGVRKRALAPPESEESEEEEFERLVELFGEFEDFRQRHFESWAKFRTFLDELLDFRDQFGSEKYMMIVIGIKLNEEKSDKKRKRGSAR